MLVPRYLDISIASLTREQEKFRNQMAQAFGGSPFGAIEETVRRNMEIFERTLRCLRPFVRQAAGGTSAAEPEPEKTAPKGGDIDDLKRQLEEMQRKVDKLSGNVTTDQAAWLKPFPQRRGRVAPAATTAIAGTWFPGTALPYRKPCA